MAMMVLAEKLVRTLPMNADSGCLRYIPCQERIDLR